ncbi:MAG: putative diguanylate cyclase YcdT [Elusimicrobia bacterium ADurb.Bin231]|nr:MAG: putative diguanylate cyclase YcdT [Elusimicrobia bacterium ADurb.Bin231]
MRKLMGRLKITFKTLIVVGGFAVLIFLFALDRLTGLEPSFTISYILPAFLIAWFMGRGTGIIISMISAILATILTTIAIFYEINPGDLTVALYDDVAGSWNFIARFGFVLVLTYVLLAIRGALEYERDFSRTDYLTGIPNRRYFFEMADIEIKRFKRYTRPFTVAYIDIDYFKNINDTLGHTAGDDILKTVTAIIKNSIRTIDLFARIGGDEFAILFPETDEAVCKTVIERMRNNFSTDIPSAYGKITLSIGVVTFRITPYDADDMLNQADRVMYEVKKSGRNNVKYKTIAAGDSRSTGADTKDGSA